MGRVMAIDYGSKRMGIAVTDSLAIIATPLTTIHPDDFFIFFEKYLKDNTVKTIVVGAPKTLQNEPATIEQHIVGMIRKIKKQYPSVWIVRMDERFTSKIAGKSLLTSGASLKTRKDKSVIDQISAVIILQDYLAYR